MREYRGWGTGKARGYCGGEACEDEKRGVRGGRARERELQRHITNAIPDPHGSAHIALLFGFN